MTSSMVSSAPGAAAGSSAGVAGAGSRAVRVRWRCLYVRPDPPALCSGRGVKPVSRSRHGMDASGRLAPGCARRQRARRTPEMARVPGGGRRRGPAAPFARDRIAGRRAGPAGLPPGTGSIHACLGAGCQVTRLGAGRADGRGQRRHTGWQRTGACPWPPPAACRAGVIRRCPRRRRATGRGPGREGGRRRTARRSGWSPSRSGAGRACSSQGCRSPVPAQAAG